MSSRSFLNSFDPERNLWDQQPEEGGPAFKAFAAYRDLGFDRSLKKVAGKLKKSAGLIDQWSLRYRWKDRVQAWDKFNDQLAQRELVKQRLEFDRTTLLMADQMRQKAMAGLMALTPVVERDGKKHPMLKINELLRLVELSHELHSEHLGSPDTDKVANVEFVFNRALTEEEELLMAAGRAARQQQNE
jgi:hypothetical protein